jgi:hypothetical protein
MSQEYPKKGDNYGQFSMKINGCPLFTHKYRTIEDKSKGACLSAERIPLLLFINSLGIFLFKIIRQLFGKQVLKPQNFSSTPIPNKGDRF